MSERTVPTIARSRGRLPAPQNVAVIVAALGVASTTRDVRAETSTARRIERPSESKRGWPTVASHWPGVRSSSNAPLAWVLVDCGRAFSESRLLNVSVARGRGVRVVESNTVPRTWTLDARDIVACECTTRGDAPTTVATVASTTGRMVVASGSIKPDRIVARTYTPTPRPTRAPPPETGNGSV